MMNKIVRLLMITVPTVMLFASCIKEAQQPPNILMIAVDDLNNWVGAWGGQAHTPNIDRLAGESVQFKNA
ncbi:MAG: hypothetical protein MI922_08310, partial [Bacteroidales bacterium]|nr:hypothetical protein [Bacteroidales bacterium]